MTESAAPQRFRTSAAINATIITVPIMLSPPFF